MTKTTATVVSVHKGSTEELHKDKQASIEVDLDGVIGDRHRSYQRESWGAGDKQAEGTVRRNERQWSAVSIEELAEIQNTMDLVEPLTAASLGANLCLSGIRQLSRLPKGTTLTFPSGVVLIVEEYNPPCSDMGNKLASIHTTHSGSPVATTAFSQAAKLTRGIVGVVEVAGEIRPGDDVSVDVYKVPDWLHRD
ncbi:MAG: MOSC domain-containing protein [Gammaproteobacteria bacterium]|nr:MOSC domain-containing protein [Gammaproteobacteria bacterium]